MKPHAGQFGEHPDPLPQEFSAPQRAVDARLTHAAGLEEVPVGLNARIFQASVLMLPHRRKSTALRLVGAGRAAFERLTWGRLAMAAMLLMSCCIAVWVMNTQQNVPSGGGLVAHRASLTRVDWLPEEATAQLHQKFSFLIDTNDLTSPDDINDDLVSLVSKLEM